MSLLNPTPDLSAIAEQLCRIEHKLDLVVEFLASTDGAFPLRPMRPDKVWPQPHRDPLTLEEVQYQMDFLKRYVVRRTSDGTGLVPPFVFTQPTATNTGSNNSGSESGSDG